MTSPQFMPMPPGGRDEDQQAGDAQEASSGMADAATRPFEEAPDVETEQATGNAPLDPNKGAP